MLEIKPGYKIIEFENRGSSSLDGRVLARQCWDPQDPNRISAELLRQHFRQVVLANMRGAAGAPVWESDFPPSHDATSEMPCKTFGKEWLKLQLAARLAPSRFGAEA